MTIPGDNPISEKKDDSLGRHEAAQSFASHVLSQDASEGVVVGVLGPWGSGKTSFINLAREDLEKGSAAVVDFNPWMFSGAEQLVSSFFVEIAAQLQLKTGLEQVGKELGEYGEAFSGLTWLPIIGPWLERLRGATKLLGKLWERRKSGVTQVRAKVSNALTELEKPIVVVLDDIDRLETDEIRDVFKLVRLTANFPNLIYLVAFDRARVEKALQEDGVPGRDYLEKILMIAVDLPAVPRQTLSRQTTIAIDEALSDVSEPGPFDEQVWPDFFVEIIQPLVRNMRDVRRYAASLRGTVVDLQGQVSLADVLSLEAIRVFMPDVFGRLHTSVEALTTPVSSYHGASRDYESERLKAQVDKLLDVAEDDQVPIVESMIKRLFPAAERHIGGTNYDAGWQKSWLKGRRVAHRDLLALYLERVAGDGLRSFLDAERAWVLISDEGELDAYLRSLPPERLETVVSSLETFEDDYKPEHVVPGVVVLLNLLPDLPDRPRGMFDLDPRLVVSRVTYRLLRSLQDPDLVKQASEEALPRITSLSSKLELISDIGYREGAGHKLVTESHAAAFESAWRDEVRAATPAELAKESDLLRVLIIAKKEAGDNEDPIELADDPDLTLAMLKAARSEVRSQAMGSRAVSRSTRLAWDVLVDLYQDEDTLRQRLEDLKQQEPEGLDDLLELADKYLAGWKPDDS